MSDMTGLGLAGTGGRGTLPLARNMPKVQQSIVTGATFKVFLHEWFSQNV